MELEAKKDYCEGEENKKKEGRFFHFKNLDKDFVGREEAGGFFAALRCRIFSLLRMGHQFPD